VHEYVSLLEFRCAPLIASADLGLSSYCVKATPATCKKIYTVASGDYCSKIQTSQSISNATMYGLNPWLDAGCGWFSSMPSSMTGSLWTSCRPASRPKYLCWLMMGRVGTHTRGGSVSITSWNPYCRLQKVWPPRLSRFLVSSPCSGVCQISRPAIAAYVIPSAMHFAHHMPQPSEVMLPF
jgi:hypothetical protein